MSCTLCNLRKPKRFCPAVHDRICAVCCGEQREITLDCPNDCVYLQEARKHEHHALKDLPRAALFPEVEIREQFLYEREPLLTGLSFALAKSARADRTLRDSDLIAAVTTLAQKQQTLVNSGLHVGGANTSPVQQAIISGVENMLAEYREMEQKHVGYSSLRDSDVLLALVFLVRMAYSRSSGRPRSRAFVDFLCEQFPERSDSIAAPQGSSIVIP
ncbi:MAG TPA: hypothetical protein VFA71_01305 [Terriglobales bacterium]|nr:hypothetical protein [Terriglobales bacterium]